MDSDELRAGCVRAGIETRDRDSGFYAGIDGGLWMQDDNPALPAYVAERLLAMIAAEQEHGYLYRETMWARFGTIGYLIDAAARIKICMAVLP
jgi:hypothetical protein